MLNFLSALPALAIYAVVAGLVFGEAAIFIGVVLSGETALLIGGALAGMGRLSLPVLIVLAVVAAVAGDSVGYEVGRRLGPRLTTSRAGRLVGEGRWTRAEETMARQGGWAVLFGRWVGVLRALMPAIAGATRMPYRRFLPFNAVGGTIWAVAVLVAAYLAGASWERVQKWLGGASGVVAGVLVLAVVTVFVVRRVRAHRRERPVHSR